MAILGFRVLQAALLLPLLARPPLLLADSPQVRNGENRELSVRELSFDEMLRESRKMSDSNQFDDERSALWDKYRDAIRNDSKRKDAHKDRRIKDGDKTMRFSMKVKGERPANSYPLYIALHGGGGTASVINDMQWEDMQSYYLDGVEKGIYVATRGVTDTWNLHFVDESYRLYDYLIENMIAFEDVDPNRVYILGFSAGGDGVYQITPRMPDRFAAANMSAGHHNWIKFDNLFQTPLLIQVGEFDSAYKRNTVAVENAIELDRLHDLRGGYVHDVFVHYHGSHNSWADNDPDGREQRILADPVDWLKNQSEDTVMKDTNAIHWLDQYSRDPYPKKLVWDPNTNAPRSIKRGAPYLSEDGLRTKLSEPRELFYWLDISPATSIPEKIVMEATYDRGENELQLSGLGKLDALRVLVHPKMLDFRRDVKVFVDSREVGSVTLNADRQVMARTLLERGDANYIFPAEINLKQGDEGSWTIQGAEEGERSREQGTYIYCSKDNCRTAFRGELSLFFGNLPKAVRANCEDPNAYAMTFDDGPSEHWPEVLAALEKHGIKATFFVIGDHLKSPENQALLREASGRGHQISNHTRSHPDLLKESDDGVLDQIKSTEESIVSILGSSPDVLKDAKIVRPPYGYIDERVQSVFAEHGYSAVRWNSDRSDWELGADQAALELTRLDQHLKFMRSQGAINSSIIDLNHDFSGATLANLDLMIERIQAAGYHFVTLRECLEGGSAPHAYAIRKRARPLDKGSPNDQ